MKKSKKIITFTLIITSLFLSGCGIFTGSKSNGLIFRDIDSNTCEVIGYEEPISKKIFGFIPRLFTKEQGVDIVIPSKYEDKKVVSIGEGAFANFYNLKSIVIPNSVTSIGLGAFYECSSLKSIVIPNSVTSIGEHAFLWCSSLENVYNNGTIEDWCNIKFRGYVSNPMYYAEHFYMKDSNNEYYEVTEIEIPNTVTSIGNFQFYGFDNILKVVIPSSVTSIEYYVFSECSSLTIYCEATQQPSGWYSYWNYDNRPVYWGYEK